MQVKLARDWAGAGFVAIKATTATSATSKTSLLRIDPPPGLEDIDQRTSTRTTGSPVSRTASFGPAFTQTPPRARAGLHAPHHVVERDSESIEENKLLTHEAHRSPFLGNRP